jgi:hypothetical protein
MPNCEICGEYDYFKYECQFCRRILCMKHHLPEEHNCYALKILKEKCRDGGVLSVKLMHDHGYLDENGKYTEKLAQEAKQLEKNEQINNQTVKKGIKND